MSSSDNTKLTLERPTTPVSARICESGYEVPLVLGESVHIGYRPITEAEAFSKTPLRPIHPPTGFDWARGAMSCERAIVLIRKFVWANNSYFLIPKPSQFNVREAIYESTVSYTDASERNVGIQIALHAAKSGNQPDADDRIVVEVIHRSGEYRTFTRFYKSLRFYVESNGKIDPQIYSCENRLRRHPFPEMPKLSRDDRIQTESVEPESILLSIEPGTESTNTASSNWLYDLYK